MRGKGSVCRSAQVNGTKKNRCVTVGECVSGNNKKPSKEIILARLKTSFIGVFCNDFAAVDAREELCY